MSVVLNQSLITVSPEGVFATARDIQVTPNIHEVFDGVEYGFELFTNGSLTYRGQSPRVHTLYNQTGKTNVSLHVLANISVHEAGWPLEIHTRKGWSNLTIHLKGTFLALHWQ